MNNDLEQFSEERLMKLSEYDCAGAEEVCSLARIALAAKQAKPVALVVIDKHTDEVMLDISDEGLDLQAGDALYATPHPAHTEQAIPDGWKLVPIEPTAGMHTAARDWSVKKYGMGVGIEGSDGCYKAMLAATPKPESE
ncbi:hypothetical protein [Rahnella variigena]|uniref:hypothetical protein n=1 Tax=Rahnella variigena TaxID=574964 RepID=UPI00132FB5CD|nr:hypothetical protein [Rahnella variigena]